MSMSRYSLLIALLVCGSASAQVTTERVRLTDSSSSPRIITLRAPGSVSSNYSFVLPGTPMPSAGSLLYGANATTGQLGWIAPPGPGNTTNVLTITNNAFSYTTINNLLGGSAWLLTGNTGITDTTNYLGTLNNRALRLITGSGGPNVRMTIDSNGRVGINQTSPAHQLEVTNSSSTDEFAAVRGVASANTSNQAIGVWGDATNSGNNASGGIGVLATGNGSSDTSRVNTALQIADGSLRIGRTREVGTGYTTDSAGATGVQYSTDGPSGVITLNYGAGLLGGLLGVGQTLIANGITVNNKYVTPNSIIMLEIIDFTPGLLNRLLGANIIWSKAVRNRTNGAFDLWMSLQNLGLLGLNIGTNNSVTVGYVVINPTK